MKQQLDEHADDSQLSLTRVPAALASSFLEERDQLFELIEDQ